MVDEKDIYRAAKKVIDLYPVEGEAELAAAQCADVALAKGDPFNVSLWKRVLNAIHILKTMRAPAHVTVH